VKRLNDELKKKIDMINRGEVPEGYKKTKVGIIPEDWEVKKLGETRDMEDKYSFTGGPFGSDLKTEHYTSNGVRVLQLQNIGDGNFINDYKIYTSNKKADELYSCNIFPGEILIAKMAEPLARACIVPDSEERYLMASDGIRLKVNSDKYITKYILECINSNYFRNKAIKKGTGTTRLRIGLGELAKIKLAIAKKEEQQKIAQILSTWDEAIELKEKLLEEKKKQKEGVMQKLLTGKIRLPGFNGEWKKVKLKNTGVIVTGTTPSTKIKEYYENGVYPWVTPTDITEKKYISKTERYLTYKGLKVGRFLPAGSLLVTCIASIGKNAILTTDGSCNQQINAILPSKNHSNEFLYYLISYRVDYIKSYAGTSATKIINKSTFENLKFFIPSLPEQKAIAKVLSTADREIYLLTQELEQLKLQKKGLMQLLLTGIVRV
jgi:type I restriction enzyme S subunit